MEEVSKKLALFTVTEKGGKPTIVETARQLFTRMPDYWEIISTGGTYETLKFGLVEFQDRIKDIRTIVGPHIGDLVKTLSRQVATGLLAPEDAAEIFEQEGCPPVNMLVVDFYPLEKAIAERSDDFEYIRGKTDVGGPTSAHEAAKGRRIIIARPKDRQWTLDWMANGEPDREETLLKLAGTADTMSGWHVLQSGVHMSKGQFFAIMGEKAVEYAKGENAHQSPGRFYETDPDDPFSLAKFRLIAGNEPSFNNAGDITRLLRVMRRAAAAFDLNRGDVPNIAVAVKHGNACGAGIAWNLPRRAIESMIEGDNRALFGGVVMTNFEITPEIAETLHSHHLRKGEKRRILDCVVAPAIPGEAVALLERKKTGGCRFVVNSALASLSEETMESGMDVKSAPGGVLVQPASRFVMDMKHEQMESFGGSFVWQDWEDLFLAWAIGSSSCSNTITIVKDGKLLGNGVAQQDRVTACRLARDRAKAMGHNLFGAVAYSDSFFPFADAVMVLIRAGIRGIFASSGSKIGDEKVKACCQKYGVKLLMLPDAICRGFQH